MNTRKTEFMTIDGGNGYMHDVDGDAIEQLNEFRNVGSMIVRIVVHNETWVTRYDVDGPTLMYVLSARQEKEKGTKPLSVHHGSENWEMTVALEEILSVSEMRMARWICRVRIFIIFKKTL